MQEIQLLMLILSKMSYTREQAEEVLKDYNSHFGLKVYLTDTDNLFLDHKFPKQKSGWYKTKVIFNNKWLVYHDFENGTRYGFDANGAWFDRDINIDLFNPKDDYLATPEEVEERLIEEAKRRGFVKGVRYKSVFNEFVLFEFEGRYQANGIDKGGLACYIDQIMFRGKWAEIVERPETELTRTIKKAEKIADKLEKLLSSQRS